jgi:ABC-type uncharacterized transport system permease subunit
MALSRMDKKLAGLGGTMLVGGLATNQTVGKNNSPVGYAGSAASIGGTTTLGLVGAGELMEHIGLGSRVQMRKYGQDAMHVGRNIMSSARRAAPGMKLLAGRIAQGANRVI